MNATTRFVISALAFAGAFFVALSGPALARADEAAIPTTNPAEGVRHVAILVRDHARMVTKEGGLYLASSANAWNPKDESQRLIRMRHDAIDKEGKVIKQGGPVEAFAIWVPLELAKSGTFEFKLTRGGWDTVEVDEAGNDVANRSIPAAACNDGEYEVVIEGFADQRGTRWPIVTDRETQRREPSVTGTLEIAQIKSPTLDNVRAVRVWLPRGYNDPVNKDRRYPVLYMNDGQNIFDRATSFAGNEWGADETAQNLIDTGKIEPLIIVGIDNTGETRSQEYNPPYTEFQGKKNYADKYLAFVKDDVMGWVNSKYRTKTGPENTSFGGSSFGGNVTLYAAMAEPGLFGRILIESPAVFISDKSMLQKAREFEGAWPAKVFIAVGTAESSKSGEAEEYLLTVEELANIFKSKGLGEDRLKFVIDDGGKHNEADWARRLAVAMGFLFAK